MPTEDDFWHTIGERPDDSLPRLAFADWLEENVTPDRDCEECDGQGSLIGDPNCYHCHGAGRVGDPDSDYSDGTTDCLDCDRVDCPTCSGTGRISDGRAELADALRMTSDRVPSMSNQRRRMWGCDRTYYPNGEEAAELPRAVFDELHSPGEEDHLYWKTFSTAELAIRDLCRASTEAKRKTLPLATADANR